MNPGPTLKQLKAFAAIAATGSFTEAAMALHLTQSAISVLIRDLEQELGVQLLDRTTRKVTVTEAGHELLPTAQSIFNNLAATVERLNDIRDKKSGTLRVAAPQLMASTVMPRLISQWLGEYPGITVKLHDTLPERLLSVLRDGEVELAIGPDRFPSGREAGNTREISEIPLFRDQHQLVCPAHHPLASKKVVRWEETSAWPFIAPTRDAFASLSATLQAHGIAMAKPAHEVSYVTTAMGMVANGMGLTTCPTSSEALVHAHGLVMIPLVKPVYYRQIYIYYMAGKSLSPAANSFIKSIQAWVSQSPEAKPRTTTGYY